MAKIKNNSYYRKKRRTRKKKSKFAWVGRFFLILLVVLCLGLVFRLYQSVNRSLWKGDSRFNLVFNSAPVLVASFDSFENKVDLLLIPQGTFIEAVHGYGPCRAESIYRLGQLNNQGGDFLSSSLQNYLGLPIDGYLLTSEVSFQKDDNSFLKSYLVKNLSFFSKKRQETNLSNWDLIRLWWHFRKIRPDKFNLIDLSQTQASEKILLADGSKAMKIDPKRLELIMVQFFADRKIKEEGLTISILNSTSHFGLAAKVANLIKNIGGRIVKVGELEKSGLNDDDFNC